MTYSEKLARLKIAAIGPKPDPKTDDGTRQLLRWGLWTLLAGIVAAALMKTVFGGITQQGPHTNSGWLALIVAMMCLPFGFMLTLLGFAKWLRNRRDR
jgi:hypothetical protein